MYAAPSRAEDLSGLPPTFIGVGSAEVFRDEDVAYASRIWAAGGIAELHVWPGGFHGFDGLAPMRSSQWPLSKSDTGGSIGCSRLDGPNARPVQSR